MGTFIVAAISVILFIFVVKSYAAATDRHGIPASAHEWPETGEFDFNIVGESHYQRNIAAIAGEHGPDGPDVITTAHLIPESDNAYDNNAVRVDIEGRTVGYMSRDDAKSFRGRLRRNKMSNKPTTCKATIMGGHLMVNGEKASYGILLDIKEFNN